MSLYHFPAVFSVLFLVTLAPFKWSIGINECNFHTLTSTHSYIMGQSTTVPHTYPTAGFRNWIVPSAITNCTISSTVKGTVHPQIQKQSLSTQSHLDKRLVEVSQSTKQSWTLKAKQCYSILRKQINLKKIYTLDSRCANTFSLAVTVKIPV